MSWMNYEQSKQAYSSPTIAFAKLVLVNEAAEKPLDWLAESKRVIVTAVAAIPKETENLAKERAELYLFGFTSGSFMLHNSSVVTTISEIGKW